MLTNPVCKQNLQQQIIFLYSFHFTHTHVYSHWFFFFSPIPQVTDTNDNPPIFDEPVYSFDIPENAPRGYQVGIIAATDPDLGDNALVSYTVISDWANDVFSLNPQTGVFTLTARLDYEEVSDVTVISFWNVENEILSFEMQ